MKCKLPMGIWPAVVIIILVILAAIYANTGRKLEAGGGPVNVYEDLGSGVVYFNASFGTRVNFGERLAKYKAAHPELQVTAIAHDIGANGIVGFWVNFEQK